MKEVNDVREYEEEDGNGTKTAAGLLKEPQAESHGDDDDAGHHNSAQG